MKTGDSVKMKFLLIEYILGQRLGMVFLGLPYLAKKSQSCSETSSRAVRAREVPIVPLEKAYNSYPELDKKKQEQWEILLKIYLKSLTDLEKYQYKRKMIPGPPNTPEGDFYKKNHKTRYGTEEIIEPGNN